MNNANDDHGDVLNATNDPIQDLANAMECFQQIDVDALGIGARIKLKAGRTLMQTIQKQFNNGRDDVSATANEQQHHLTNDIRQVIKILDDLSFHADAGLDNFTKIQACRNKMKQLLPRAITTTLSRRSVQKKNENTAAARALNSAFIDLTLNDEDETIENAVDENNQDRYGNDVDDDHGIMDLHEIDNDKENATNTMQNDANIAIIDMDAPTTGSTKGATPPGESKMAALLKHKRAKVSHCMQFWGNSSSFSCH